MKRMFLIFVAMATAIGLSAQAFEMGKSYLSLGYGLGNLNHKVVEQSIAVRDAKFSSFGALFLKYEYALTKKTGVGLNIAYRRETGSAMETYIDINKNVIDYTQNVIYSAWSALARINYHIGEDKFVDPYIGFGLGFRSGIWGYSTSVQGAPSNPKLKKVSPIGVEMTLGCKVLLSDHYGAYSELGFSKGVFQIGAYRKF